MMGDHIEGTSAIPTDTEASGWAELAHLRQELDDVKKIIQALQTMIAENMQHEDERIVEPLWKWNTEKGTKGPKMVKPAFFTGKMDEMEAFINSCTMYIVGQANDFLTDRAAIMWVLSYMQAGLALEWRDDYLEDMEKGVLKHTTLEAFFEMLKEEFGDPDKQATKIYKLRTLVQGNHTTDEHVQTFKKAVWGAGYYGNALIEEFKCSLHSRLRERISNLDNVPETIEGWYHQAMRLDRQWRQAKKESEYYVKMTGLARTQPRTNEGHFDNKPPMPAKDPNTMDVDRGWRRGPSGQSQQQWLPLICFKCRKPRHLARNCHVKMDVHAMTYDKLVATVREDEKMKQEDFQSKDKWGLHHLVLRIGLNS
jgi:hypothetical protein